MTRQSNKPDGPSSSSPVIMKITNKKSNKNVLFMTIFAALFLLLIVFMVMVLADGTDFFTKTSAMSPVLPTLNSNIQTKDLDSQSDLKSPSRHQKDRMAPFAQDKRSVIAKVLDKDTNEPIVLTEALITLKPEVETKEGSSLTGNEKQNAENNDLENKETGNIAIIETKDQGDESGSFQLVLEEGNTYKSHGISSGDEGIVLFEIPGHLSGSGYVTMNAPGYMMKTSSLSVSKGESLDLGVVYLEVKWRVYGMVTDLDANPIEGAEVMGTFSRYCFRKKGESIKETIEHNKTTKTDGCFSFSSKDDVRDQWYPQTIYAKAVGYETRFVDTVEEKTMPIVIALAKGREICGRVLWSFDESPIAGIRLTCPERMSGGATLLETVTDEEGRFVFPGFPAHESSLAINISHPIWSHDLVIRVPESINDLGDIIVDGPVSVGVTVFEWGTKHTVKGAKVNSGPMGFNFKTQSTDDYGNTVITGIPSGKEFPFWARADGYYLETNNYKNIITGPPGSHHSLELTLKKKPVTSTEFIVYGKVIDRCSDPVPDAMITLYSYSDERNHYPSNTKHRSEEYNRKRLQCQSDQIADESGSFEIRMNDLRWIETVVVEHPRYAPFKSDGTFLNGTIDREITLTMNEITEWFYGRVCTDGDSPVHGASVEIEYKYIEGNELGLSHRFNYRATTDSLGLFALPYFPEMRFTLKAWKEKEKSKTITGLSEEDIVPGENCVELVLSTKENMYVSFICKRASGAPMVNFRVGSGSVSPSAVTGFRGEAVWEHLDNQKYCLNIFDSHNVIGMYGYNVIPVPNKDHYLRIEMIPGRYVKVAVILDLAGKAFDGQAETINLLFEEQRWDQWIEAKTSIPSAQDKMIKWDRRVYKEEIYNDTTTGNPVVSFVTFLYEGIFRVKLSADGFQEVLSEPFAITENSETLRMNYTLDPL